MIVQIPLRFSNVYIVKEGFHPVLIDTGSPSDFRRIEAGLFDQGLVLHDISLIIHTHAHFNHAGNTAAIKQHVDIPALIHRLDFDNLKNGTNGAVKHHSLTGYLIKKMVLKNYPAINADVVFDDEMSLQAYGIKGKLLHTPGHTPGSSSVLFETGEAIVGDVFMGGLLGGYAFPKIAGYPYFIDNIGQLYKSIKKLLDMGAEKFYTGYGGPLSRKEVERKFKNAVNGR
jgi:hydroxyacylglutathione hydrolase